MRMRRGKPLLEGSRQGSVDGGQVAVDKELVHKCHSDPGGGRALGAQRHRSHSGTTRKCVLTLDGYSYVIAKWMLTTSMTCTNCAVVRSDVTGLRNEVAVLDEAKRGPDNVARASGA
ncbi:hypothetical protein EVAR_14088_1 [Eumeta japonica]|uniref:Uncharacterized protein n=1 Tax=Eumeta variegata TaxID=151549 RepID=A0A4C1UNI9_EUMVA|nr:hypothetical protein EVAR_14088_1 [Eumeta japonica]